MSTEIDAAYKVQEAMYKTLEEIKKVLDKQNKTTTDIQTKLDKEIALNKDRAMDNLQFDNNTTGIQTQLMDFISLLNKRMDKLHDRLDELEEGVRIMSKQPKISEKDQKWKELTEESFQLFKSVIVRQEPHAMGVLKILMDLEKRLRALEGRSIDV